MSWKDNGTKVFAVALAIAGFGLSGPAMAQWSPLVVAPRYRTVTQAAFRPATNPYASVMPAPPVQVQIGTSFRLAQTGETQVSDSVTDATYVARRVPISIYPVGAFGTTLRLVGDLTITTETTTDANGNGTIVGTLTFTNPAVGTVLTGQLQGTVGDGAGPLQVAGEVRLPGTTPYERPSGGNFTANLGSDSDLNATLSGAAVVQSF